MYDCAAVKKEKERYYINLHIDTTVETDARGVFSVGRSKAQVTNGNYAGKQRE